MLKAERKPGINIYSAVLIEHTTFLDPGLSSVSIQL